MIEKRSAKGEERVWTRRDRSIVPTNRIRARAMRSNPTRAEQKLWWHLRYRLAATGPHFRRQVHLGRYIVDFADHKLKIVIELDGGQHLERVEADAKRTKFLQSEGYKVLRFWNMDVLQNIDGVLETIQRVIVATPTPRSSSRRRDDDLFPSPQGGGDGMR